MTTSPERKAVEKWLAQWGIHNDAEIAGLLDALDAHTLDRAVVHDLLRGTEDPANWGVPDDYAAGWVAAIHAVEELLDPTPETTFDPKTGEYPPRESVSNLPAFKNR